MLKQERRDRQAGFTLIELMVVVAIIGILAAIGLPQLTNYIKQAETTEPVNTMGKMAQEVQGFIDSHPAVVSTAFVAAYSAGTNGLLNAVLHPTTATSTITNVIPTLVLPASAKWQYSVAKIAVDATTRVATVCLAATLVDTSTNAGQVYYSSESETAGGWDGHYYRKPYVTAVPEATPAKCGDGAST